MPKKKIEASITGEETDDWYTAGDAAKVLSINSGKTINSDYLYKLGMLNKIRTKKFTPRLTLYYKPDVDAYKVEARGKRSGEAKRERHGSTGPTVREARKADKQVA